MKHFNKNKERMEYATSQKKEIKMKKIIILFVLTAIFGAVSAQDIVYLLNGGEIKTKVLRYNAGEIEIQSPSDGQISRISVAEVKMIQYADGHKVNWVCSGCKSSNQGTVASSSSYSSSNAVSSQEQPRISLEGETQSETVLDGGTDDDWSSKDALSNDEISEIMLYFTEGTKEYKKRQKRLAKMDKTLANMAKAGLIMGAFDIFGGGSGTIGGAAAAAAAYGLLNVTRKGVDQIEQAIQSAGGWNIVTKSSAGGVTTLNGRCDDRKKEISVIRKTIAKQAALSAGVATGVALATKNAVQTKALGDIKYTALATAAVAVAVPELKLQNQVVKLARQSVESCRD